ncbi:protocadherin-20 [Chiloscyllium plagiosum]|uniref:protocadherin-20 n=1 Tax=Chiloscyllium plagiosum TaxID=36176 RepID=UPI001CB80E9B|nr:protocadherin-20 [Chiloscyllium plagiosum]
MELSSRRTGTGCFLHIQEPPPLLLLLLLLVLPGTGRAAELLYRVREESPAGTYIGNLATDLRLNRSEPGVTYNLASAAGSGRFVDLNRETGELRTSAAVLDREELCPDPGTGSLAEPCWLLLDVLLLPPRLFRLLKLRLRVEDVNDQAPRFPASSLGLSVPENAEPGSRYPLEPAAEDPEPGLNGMLRYRLQGTGPAAYSGAFSLAQEDGAVPGKPAPFLVLAAPLDRESRDRYVMELVAEDRGSPSLSGTATVTVSVSDVNDHCPEFPQSELRLSVFSNISVGSTVTRLHAQDPDLGYNARVVYSYGERVPGSSSRLFRLDPVSGTIRLAAPIREGSARLHRLTVLATGTGCAPVALTVSLNVIPVGVTGPPVLSPRYIALQADGVLYLKESEPPRTPLAFFTVTGDREPVRCYLHRGEAAAAFRLSRYQDLPGEYLLETGQPLDYELQRRYQVTVVGENADGLASRVHLQIQLIDENDNAPVFSSPSVQLLVEENNLPNCRLARLKATDADSGEMGNITYMLSPGVPPVFSVDPLSGTLSVSTSLDREEHDRYRLTIRAIDGGTPSLESTATVIITVLDVNDNSPRFINKDFNFFVPEDYPSFSEIGVIGVMDPDAGTNGWVALSILNGSEHFVIDTGKGNLMASVPLDREQQSSYILWIQATDGGEPALSAVAKVTVLLIDVNDNPPLVLFPQSNLSFLLVLPSTVPGSSITEVYAVDKDTGMNAVIAYSIIGHRGPRPETFVIDAGTGNITLHEALVKNDYGLYRLLVKVSDHGYPEPLHSTVIVNLFVNETLSNESYIENLLRKDPGIRIEESLPETRTDPFQTKLDVFPCETVLIALSALCFGLFALAFALVCYISFRRKKHRRKAYGVAEVEIPLKKTLASFSLEKKSFNDLDL